MMWSVSSAVPCARGGDMTPVLVQAVLRPIAGFLGDSKVVGNSDPSLSAFFATGKEFPGATQDTDPSDWRGDRLLAYLGLLDDAAPLFGSNNSVPRAGVLLALPALV